MSMMVIGENAASHYDCRSFDVYTIQLLMMNDGENSCLLFMENLSAIHSQTNEKVIFFVPCYKLANEEIIFFIYIPCNKIANEKMILVPCNKLANEVVAFFVPCYKLAIDILCAMNNGILALIAE